MTFSPRSLLSTLALALAGFGGCSADGVAEEGQTPAAFVVVNPTGACGTRTDAARAGYHSPAGAPWVPDCQAPLRREYWRVFATDADHGYTMPRLDGVSLLAPVCRDSEHPLRAIVDTYGLCDAARTPEDVARVNHLLIADALRITHALHGSLRFVPTEGGSGIDPFPIPSDILDACALPGTLSPELQAICQREVDRLQSGLGIGFTYMGTGGVELVARLNELYGVR